MELSYIVVAYGSIGALATVGFLLGEASIADILLAYTLGIGVAGFFKHS